jgi:hypothetical protein
MTTVEAIIKLENKLKYKMSRNKGVKCLLIKFS